MKKMMTLAFAAMLSLSASAQLISSNTITREKSNGYSRFDVSYNSLSLDNDIDESLSGVSLSWVKGSPISSSAPLFVEVGLGATYAWKSKSETEQYDRYKFDVETKTTFASIQVPVNLVYKYEVTDGLALSPYVGLYLRGNLIGETKVEVESYSEKLNWFDSDKDGGYGAKRLSLGWQIGVGVEYSKLYAGISYGSDFTKLIDIKGDEYKISSKINTFSAKVGVLF